MAVYIVLLKIGENAMTTNYYLVPTDVLESNVDLDWVKKIHIAQFSANGFLLQAVKGIQSFQRVFNDRMDVSVFYYAEVSDFDTVETWKDIRNLVLSDEYSVIDEYDAVIESDTFVQRVEENNGLSYDSRYNHMIDWLNRNPLLAGTSHFETVALDPDGYSFEYREFI